MKKRLVISGLLCAALLLTIAVAYVSASLYPPGSTHLDFCFVGWMNTDGDILLLASDDGLNVFGDDTAYHQCKGTVPMGETVQVFMNYTTGAYFPTETLATREQACELYPGACRGNGVVKIDLDIITQAGGTYIPCNFQVDPLLLTEDWEELVTPDGKAMFTCHAHPLSE